MAEPKLPDNHRIVNVVNQNKNSRTIGRAGYERRAQVKLEDYERTKDWVEHDLGVEDYLTTINSELALASHYSLMPEVEMSPDIKVFFETNKSSLEEFNSLMKGPTNEYLTTYEKWQDLVEDMDDRRRSELGIANDFDYKVTQAHEQIRSADEKVQNAHERIGTAHENLRAARTDTSPIGSIIGAITGSDEKSIHKVRDARRSLRDAQRGLRDARISAREARRRLQELYERRNDKQDSREKLEAKEYALLKKMAEAREVLELRRGDASKLFKDKKVLEIANRLHEQYAMIDKYKAIQDFKANTFNNEPYHSHIESTNPDLYKKLDSFPEKLPQKTFTITLDGKLKISSDQKKLNEIATKIEETKGKLPDFSKPSTNNLEAIRTQLDSLAITADISTSKKVEEEIVKIDNDMQSMDKTSDEYKKSNMKKDYLMKLQEVKAKQEEITTLSASLKIKELTANYNNAQTTAEKQKARAELQAAQAQLEAPKKDLKKLESELSGTPYAITLSTLKKLEKLTLEHEQLGATNDLDDHTTQTFTQLINSQSTLETGNPTRISMFFGDLYKHIREVPKKHLDKITEAREHQQALPAPQTQDHHRDDDGR